MWKIAQQSFVQWSAWTRTRDHHYKIKTKRAPVWTSKCGTLNLHTIGRILLVHRRRAFRGDYIHYTYTLESEQRFDWE